MSFLELRQVSKIYGEGPAQVQAVIDVSLSVDSGELVAVMGPAPGHRQPAPRMTRNRRP
jgi:putative ABC transport system ATP-binding protein